MDAIWGAIPIQDFHGYQRAQVALLLNTSSVNADYTVPIVVYGAHPLATFNDLYGWTLGNNQVTVAGIMPGKKTPVMATTHPYVFYGRAQGFDAIGSGKLVDATGATAQMISDLAVAGWLKRMSDNPTQDPQAALAASQTYWKDPAQAATVKALVQHQGSLKYSDPNTLRSSSSCPSLRQERCPSLSRYVMAAPSASMSSGAAAYRRPCHPAFDVGFTAGHRPPVPPSCGSLPSATVGSRLTGGSSTRSGPASRPTPA